METALDAQTEEPWHAFILMNETDDAAVQKHLDGLPRAPWLDFEIAEVI